jgi:Family of unknown function (DUF6339)
MVMSDNLDQLLNLGELSRTPSLPLVSESVVARCFRQNQGVILEQPDYVATATSYGHGHIVLPPGSIIKPSDLMILREQVIADLQRAGFTLGRKLSTDDKAIWDRTLGASLFTNLRIPLAQIGDPGVWTYLTLFVFWEFPTWRFPKKEEKDEPDLVDTGTTKSNKKPYLRSSGGPRNVLRKCWDRAFVLGPDLGLDGHPATVQSLGEDELVNIFERTTIGNNRVLAEAIVDTIFRKRPIRKDRMDIVRKFTKAVLRKTPTTHFASMGNKLPAALSDIFDSIAT